MNNQTPADRMQLAREWASAIGTTAYVPMSQREIDKYLLGLVHPLLDSLACVPFSTAVAERIGARLVEGHFTGVQSLQRTIQVLGRALPVQPELRRLDGLTEKVLAVISAIAAGYVKAMRALTFDQQEDVKRALLRSRHDVERNLRVSEARFRGVFTSTAVGIAITDLNGNFVEFNQALTAILGYRAEQLSERTVFDLVHPDDAPLARIAYRDLIDTEIDAGSFRLQRRLIRSDGETAWVFLAVSVLRDDDGAPANYVTVVEDISDLHLLQEQLSHQALHDLLTGLPNRQFFCSRMESIIGRLEPTDKVTLFHLNIDSFAVVNDGLGHQFGDRLLQMVAKRLAVVFADEQAMIARLAGDEFAVLLENSPTTPDVATLAAEINEELSEPAYIDDCGLAVTASIGVAQREGRGLDQAELIRAAGIALRRAKANGKRQWAVSNQQADSEDQARYRLAAVMPGALENGDIRLAYQPRVQLVDEQVVAVEGLVYWDRRKLGVLPHERCIELAEQTGVVLPIGKWLLRTACQQAVSWQFRLGAAAPLISVHLSTAQANDPDLVSAVCGTLAETELPADRLQLGIPVRALLGKGGDAEDNLEVLADMGVRIILAGFGTSHGGLAYLEDLPVHAVKLAAWLVARLADRPKSVSAQAVAEMIGHVHACDVSVITCNIETAEQADWWRELGADAGQGSFFAAPMSAENLTPLLGMHRSRSPLV